jgi:hypothetical protein
MSGSSYLYLVGRLQRPVVGSPEWNAAFPGGVTRDTSKAPPIDYGPTGNPYIDPVTGKPYPKSAP